MARGTRSRASRAERRLQKERAVSALQRGLPGPLPARVSASASGARPSTNPPARSPASDLAGQRLPLAVKLLALGLGLLGLVYGLTLLRDHKSVSEPVSTPGNGTGAVK